MDIKTDEYTLFICIFIYNIHMYIYLLNLTSSRPFRLWFNILKYKFINQLTYNKRQYILIDETCMGFGLCKFIEEEN